MPNPLAEVFGYPVDNLSLAADRHRTYRLCPFNNKVPNCTKDKANDPLGVCTISDGANLAITCPTRFRQDWLIAVDAAAFFFPPGSTWTSLTEVRLKDADGESAGNIDIVLVAYNDRGQVIDFGALEIQAVYISGNVRRPFEHYMEDPNSRTDMNWTGANSPRPDYLSSSRKRLAPQLIYKGGILKAWNKKIAVAIHSGFFATLPKFPTQQDSVGADMAWLVYDLVRNPLENFHQLTMAQTVYTEFEKALLRITTPQVGSIEKFIDHLQSKLDEKLDGNPPDVNTLTGLTES
jgi:hypothetical protein